MTAHRRRSSWRRHSLTLVAGAILFLWIVLYARSSPRTHAGSFFGNAIADWSGLVVMVLATKHLYEKGYQGALGMEHGQSLPGKEGERAIIGCSPVPKHEGSAGACE